MIPFRRFLFAFLLLAATTVPAADSPALLRIREVLASGEQPVRIVCFGDSVTGIYYHTGGRSSYPELIAAELKTRHPKTDVTAFNAGVSGHTTANGLGRLQQTVLVHKPHLVTVAFGLNDVAKGTPDLYRKNLIEIITKIRAAGAEVILCTPNAVSETPDRPVAKVAAFAGIAREVAAQMQVPLADPHADLGVLQQSDPDAWRLSMSDEIHPNLRGHRRLAESILKVIEGETVTLSDDVPVAGGLAFTLAKLQKGQPVEVLAMPPFDTLAADALRARVPGASVSVVSWPIAGLDRRILMKDAANRVRPIAPDLVLIAVPRSVVAKDREEFIRTQGWIAANSLSRGKREWDVVVIHPAVFEGPGTEADREKDELIRAIVPAQDLPLIDRAEGDTREAAELLAEWVKGQGGGE
jgi:lysophospholipase L1-like esterase